MKKLASSVQKAILKTTQYNPDTKQARKITQTPKRVTPTLRPISPIFR